MFRLIIFAVIVKSFATMTHFDVGGVLTYLILVRNSFLVWGSSLKVAYMLNVSNVATFASKCKTYVWIIMKCINSH